MKRTPIARRTPLRNQPPRYKSAFHASGFEGEAGTPTSSDAPASRGSRRTPTTDAAAGRDRMPVPRRAQLRQVSKKRGRENREYTRLRAEFLTSMPRCEFPGGCVNAATEVHHRAGRIGLLLLDTSRWSALCHDHHQHVTENPREAYELGISERRIGDVPMEGIG